CPPPSRPSRSETGRPAVVSASTTQNEAASSASAASGTEADDGPFLVYFSSTSENTHRFVTKLGYPS
ncbi:Protein nrdI, partial [human gut metagenome]